MRINHAPPCGMSKNRKLREDYHNADMMRFYFGYLMQTYVMPAEVHVK